MIEPTRNQQSDTTETQPSQYLGESVLPTIVEHEEGSTSSKQITLIHLP